jgi:hypothetical protein
MNITRVLRHIRSTTQIVGRLVNDRSLPSTCLVRPLKLAEKLDSTYQSRHASQPLQPCSDRPHLDSV